MICQHMSYPPGTRAAEADIAQALQLARHLVAQNQPLQALKVVADLLRAAGLEREAGESVSRVQQALAAGSASAHAADELAGLLSLVSLQAPQAIRTQAWPAQAPPPQVQAFPSSTGSEAVGMDVEGGTGPGPPPTHDAGDELGKLVAAAEGASYVCQRCGGVVSVARQQAHQQLWCPALHGS